MTGDGIRVAHVVNSFDTGGMEKGVATLVRCGSPGVEHVIVCLTRSGDSARQLPPGTRVVELNKPPGNSMRFIRRLSRCLQEIRPSVVHTRNWAGMDGILAARLAGLRQIVHGEHGWVMEDPRGLNRKRVLLRRLCSRWVREYTCVSRQMIGWLRETVRVRREITQIYNGIDTAAYRPREREDAQQVREELGIDPSTLLIGTVGRLDPIKDHPTLFRAFGALRRTVPHARLLVIGDGPERERLQALADSSVALLGNRRDVPRILSALDVFVLSSINEGISNTILEAMAAGLPVIATRVGGNPELLIDGQTGILVPARDSEALGKAMSGYSNRELRRGHGRAGRRRVEEAFGLESMVRGYEEVWRRVARAPVGLRKRPGLLAPLDRGTNP